jgi:hypothetical protein
VAAQAALLSFYRKKEETLAKHLTGHNCMAHVITLPDWTIYADREKDMTKQPLTVMNSEQNYFGTVVEEEGLSHNNRALMRRRPPTPDCRYCIYDEEQAKRPRSAHSLRYGTSAHHHEQARRLGAEIRGMNPLTNR